MNTLCAAGTGSFLKSQSARLNIEVEDFGDIAIGAFKKNMVSNIAARCTVFAESDLVHKLQIGHTKDSIVAGLCKAVVTNYLNNVGKGKKIYEPIIFQGGVSKNVGVKYAFEQVTGHKVTVDKNSHLMGALGVAILAKESKEEKIFNFNIQDVKFETKGTECQNCPNHCEIIMVYKNGKLIDS
jgi:activator of 2-hydroxyglutaryl-CoA dehydratase